MPSSLTPGATERVKSAGVRHHLGAMERLSGLDASFLYFETPSMHMHVAMTAIFDPSTMPGGLRHRADQGGHRLAAPPRAAVPAPGRARCRSASTTRSGSRTPTSTSTTTSAGSAAPSPGGPHELADVAAQIASTPLDRSRPLWELHVVEGLADGNFGMVVKVHHCAVDGVSGAELLVHLFDLEPGGREVEPPPPRQPDVVPSDVELVSHAIASRARHQLSSSR